MSFYRFIVGTLCFCQSAALLAMDDKNQHYLPKEIQKEIIKIVLTYKPLPAWIPWLIARNGQQPQTEEIVRINNIRVLKDHSQVILDLTQQTFYRDWHGTQVYYKLQPFTSVINSFGSFDHHKALHPYTYTINDNGMIKVTLYNQEEIILGPCQEVFIDTAFSPDNTLFSGISEHCIMIWNVQNHYLIDKISCSDHTLKKIVALSANNNSIVLQDISNTIFAFDLVEKNQHIIYSNNKWASVYPIAFDDHYILLHVPLQLSNSPVRIIRIFDIAKLFPRLHFDQIRLLSWIQKAAVTNHRLNLKGSLLGIIHARKAFLELPKKMKRLVDEFVCLPLLDSCTIS